MSDFAIACELPEIAQYVLDLADRWRRRGQVYDAWFGSRRATIACFSGGCEWECGLTALISGGARRIIHVGVCGGLRDDIQLGDLVVARQVVINDDLARCYADTDELPCSGPMLDFVEQRAPELAGSVPVHFVRAISAPTFFNQTRERLHEWSQRADIVDIPRRPAVPRARP